jgi:hypothetical protein
MKRAIMLTPLCTFYESIIGLHYPQHLKKEISNPYLSGIYIVHYLLKE